MTKRIKVLHPVIRTREQMEAIVRETVALQIQREADIAARDAEVLAVQERHNKSIDETTAAIERNVAMVQQWSDANAAEFGRDRSITTSEGHRIGYRLGQPHPKPLKKATWKSVVALIKDLTPSLRSKLLRIKEEPNKEAMVAMKDSPEILASIGVEIVQNETFYVEPNRETPATRLAAKDAA